MTLEELFGTHRESLIRRLTAYSRDAHAAEDAVSKAFLKALVFGELPDMPEGAAVAWLYVTARNALTDEKRRQSRRAELDIDLAFRETDPDDMIMLHDLLERLPPEQRQIVTLRYLTGLDSATIGHMLGIPAATVRTRLRAAMKKLRNALERHDKQQEEQL